jgi:hypothetical protein
VKRRPALRQLSREHHGALVLALRITKAGDATAVARLMATVPDVFARELEPHFRDEEADLLPGLAAAGADALVRRTLLPAEILDAAPPEHRTAASCRLAPR